MRKASAIAKSRDVKLAPVPAYVEYYKTPMKKDPMTVSKTDKDAWCQSVVDKASKIRTLVGTGQPGDSGDGGDGRSATLNSTIAIDDVEAIPQPVREAAYA